MEKFNINYSFSNRFESACDKSISEADEMALRYSLFLGSVYLKSNRSNINLGWSWIPVIDFALCLFTICNNILQKVYGEEKFEFAESDRKIIFQKYRNELRINTSFSDEIIEIGLIPYYYSNLNFKM